MYTAGHEICLERAQDNERMQREQEVSNSPVLFKRPSKSIDDCHERKDCDIETQGYVTALNHHVRYYDPLASKGGE